MKFRLAILAGGITGALLSACVSVTRPPLVVPPPPTFALVVHVFKGDPSRDDKIVLAKVSTGNGDPVETDGAGNVTVAGLRAGTYTVCVSAEGFHEACDAVVIPDTSSLSVSLVPVFPFSAEVGALRVDGGYFLDSQGQTWDWRGWTQFTVFARFLRGEDITPRLDEARRYGANVIRVFGQVPRIDGWRGWEDYARPDLRPDYAAQLGAFFDLAASHGLRVEYVPLTYALDVPTMRQILQRAYDVAAGRWNVFLEAANEPDGGQGIDVSAAMQGVDRHGVLSAYGLANPVAPPGTDGRCDLPGVFATLPTLDYVTVHPDRGSEWPRKMKDLLEYRDDGVSCPPIRGLKKPIVGDEPIGAAETVYRGGRSTTTTDFIAGFGICRIFAAGCTYHFDDGIQTTALRPVQASIAAAVLDVWRFVPPDAQRCSYTRGGLNYPLAWADGDSLRSYGVVCANVAYLVEARPRDGRTHVGINGWSVSAEDASRLLVKVQR